MVLTNITNKRKEMAERLPGTSSNDDATSQISQKELNMPLAKRVQLIREKQKKDAERAKQESATSGVDRETGAPGGAFKTGSLTQFVIFEDNNAVSPESGDGEDGSQERTKETTNETLAESTTFTTIKDKNQDTCPEKRDAVDTEEESVVCVFARKKAQKENEKAGSSGSESSTSPQEYSSADSKDDNHNTVAKNKKKKLRRAAIGFPSEEAANAPEPDTSETTDTEDKQRFDIELAIEKLPLPDELPSAMSADQIADIDKLFDSLVPDYAAPVVSTVEKKEVLPEESHNQSRRRSERRKSTRRTSFILPCHMSQPDVPLLEQTDDSTPIHDKKFRLPSSGEDSLTPATVTPVVQVEAVETEKETSSTKRGKQPRKVKAKTKKRVKRPEGHSEESTEVASTDMNTDTIVALPAPQIPPPSKAKRRRRSADSDIMAQEIQRTPSPDTLYENLPKEPPRRSGRIRRRSIEIYRRQQRKEAGEESPNSSSDGRDTPEATGNSQAVTLSSQVDTVSEQKFEPMNTSVPETNQSGTEIDSDGQSSAPATPDSANTSWNVESPAKTPSGSAKGKTRRGKRKREPSVEDIYQNKLWRTQMPKERNWETIFEEPRSKKGHEEYQSNKKFKRFCNFEEFYNQTRLKRRRQKAMKQGWKPLTKKKEEKASKLVEEKIMALDQELIEEEIPTTSISETLALLGDPLVSLPVEQTETKVSASPVKQVVSHCTKGSQGDSTTLVVECTGDSKRDTSVVTDSKSENSDNDAATDVPNTSLDSKEETVKEKELHESACSGKSSQSDLEYFTPNTTLTKSYLIKKDSMKEQKNLSAIGEGDDELFFTPAAKVVPDTADLSSSTVELPSPTKDSASKSPSSSDKSSDSLSLTKTPARSEEVVDMSGIYSLSPFEESFR